MIKLDFDFDSKLKGFEDSQYTLQKVLADDLQKMKQIVGQPLNSPAIPKDLIKWSENLFDECLDSHDITNFTKACPRILKYITLSPKLKQYFSNLKSRVILFKLLERFPRERPISNLLLYFFIHFLSVDDDVTSSIQTLLLTYFKEKTPRVELSQFYINNKLNIAANRSTIVNNVLANTTIKDIATELPLVLRGTEFHIELLITISGKLHDKPLVDNIVFWEGLDSLANRELYMICLAKYALNSTLKTDIELCKYRAMKHVGDPSQLQIWKVTDKYKKFQTIVDRSRKKIEIWINEQFIAAFFQTMQATNRGDFWLNYVKYMERVQILGSPNFLVQMKQKYPSAAQYLDNSERFKKCGYNSDACVFMYFANHIIILFDTENKAGICRKKDDNNLPEFKYYGNVTSIIDGGFHKAYRVIGQNIYDIKEEGRLFHSYGWKEHFQIYLEKIVI